ncbi:hypothetical protein EGM87_22615 [Sphingobium sp. RSMS]|uniref:hypothetical protein n=1 Tax=Sphingobium sp. RSMS TaxID=520734 RepID=UPI0010F69542|nr:hypothetical protein [Sphingobium sp. RSMS]UXC93092.1 hypothetical protein EGM87_22615 [Sphingobium sp. RSMS]
MTDKAPVTVEQALPDLIVTKGGVPFADQAEGIRQFKAACLAASKETDRLARDLNIKNADHIALWLEANMADSGLGWLACRIVEAHEQSTAALEEQITGLIHDVERYIKAGSEEAARAAALEEEIKRLREALTPSGSTKAAYHGEFSFNLHRIDDCGDEYVEKVYVPWDTVKQIMKAILARTALEGRGS